MTVQGFVAAIDGFISAFFAFAKGVLMPIAVLAAFFAGVRVVIEIVPMLNAWVPSALIKGDPLRYAAVSIACALAGQGATWGERK